MRRGVAFIALDGKELLRKAYEFCLKVRDRGVKSDWFSGVSLRSDLRKADKLGYSEVVVVGEDEIKAGKYVIKDMAYGLPDGVVDEKDLVDVLVETYERPIVV